MQGSPPSPRRPRLALVLRISFAAALLAVLVLSLLPPASLPPVNTGWDKADHAFGWFGLGLLGLAAWPDRPVAVLSGLVVFGALVEWLQSLTGYRFAEWADLLADTVGVAAVALVHRLYRRHRGAGRPG